MKSFCVTLLLWQCTHVHPLPLPAQFGSVPVLTPDQQAAFKQLGESAAKDMERLVPEEAKQKMRSLFKSNLDSLPEAIRNDISTKQGEVLAMLPEAARKSIDGTPSNLKFVQQVDEASQTLDVELRSRVKDKMMEGYKSSLQAIQHADPMFGHKVMAANKEVMEGLSPGVKEQLSATQQETQKKIQQIMSSGNPAGGFQSFAM